MVRFVLSEPEKTLLPSDEDVRFYQDHGWYLSQPLLSEQGVDALAEAADRYWRGHRDRRLPVRPPHIEYWEPSHGDVSRNNDYIFYEDDTFGSVDRKSVV